MPLASRLKSLMSSEPVAVGSAAPKLSLTADEGTWIKLPDFQGHIHVILLFFRSLTDDETDRWLRDFQTHRDQFEELETVVFGVTTHRPERLREFRNELGIEYYLLYDPFAVDSRGFGAASRVRPICKPTTVVVDKEGKIVHSVRGMTAPDELLALAARLQGVELSSLASEEAHAFSAVRNPGQAADKVHLIDSEKALTLLAKDDGGYILVDVRTVPEYDADHAPSAVNIPLDELTHRYQELGQTTQLILVCQAGGRSAAAAEFLTSVGCSDIYNVEAGMSSWTGEHILANGEA
jgi:rhodanese-related sulfurtransferase/peroxiredoxin